MAGSALGEPLRLMVGFGGGGPKFRHRHLLGGKKPLSVWAMSQFDTQGWGRALSLMHTPPLAGEGTKSTRCRTEGPPCLSTDHSLDKKIPPMPSQKIPKKTLHRWSDFRRFAGNIHTRKTVKGLLTTSRMGLQSLLEESTYGMRRFDEQSRAIPPGVFKSGHYPKDICVKPPPLTSHQNIWPHTSGLANKPVWSPSSSLFPLLLPLPLRSPPFSS